MENFFILIDLLYSSTCFEHYYAHLQEDNYISTASGIVTPFRWLFRPQFTRGFSPLVNSRKLPLGKILSAPAQTMGLFPRPMWWVTRLFPEGKAAGMWRYHSTPSSTDVKERVQLYFYSPSGPSWPSLRVMPHISQPKGSFRPVTFTTGCSNGLINTRYCRYSVMSSWWWVEIPPETCTAIDRYE